MRMFDLLVPSVRLELAKLSNGINNHLKAKTSHEQFEERLSERDLKELMGTNRQTYKRVNGKVKRK